MRIEVTVQQTTDKIYSLRNYYSPEKCKEEAASKKSGSAREDFIHLNGSFSTFLVSKNLIPCVTKTSLKQSQMETMQSPREGKISLPVLGKMSVKGKK